MTDKPAVLVTRKLPQLIETRLMELFETRRSTRGPGVTTVPAVHFLGGGVLVYSTEDHTADADGSTTMSSGLFVSQVRDGVLVRHEIFPDDQIDAALAVARSLLE